VLSQSQQGEQKIPLLFEILWYKF